MTPDLMASGQARYPWPMVRAIYFRLEEIFSASDSWRITSPAGTEISGKIAKGSEVADAYFTQEAAGARFIRLFPGEVYSPVGSLKAEGRIVVEYINVRDTRPWQEPATLTIKDDGIVRIEGGSCAREIEREIDGNIGRHGDKAAIVDSWHGGMNPRAKVPGAEEPEMTFIMATSSPGLMHFHLGRLKDPISARISNHTVEVDGRKIYDRGRLMILDDPKIRLAAESYGLEGAV